MKQSNPQMFTIDLSKIEGKGDFPCPNCGVSISPDDESDEVYSVLETKVNGDSLEELVIQCNKCGSKIRLTGFLPKN
jgi:ribosomal protein S27AE